MRKDSQDDEDRDADQYQKYRDRSGRGQAEIIESLEDTNESLLSHNINLTMRTLTVFSAIMLPLTFLTGLFGMNVQLPFADALLNIPLK